MSSHRLDTEKLIRDVDRCRRVGAPDEISYRELGRILGVGSSLFTRLKKGQPPNADALCSLMMWLNPQALVSDYILPGDRATAAAAARRHQFSWPIPARNVVPDC